MVISKTPYRISFFGGGSDYPDYYLQYGGKVLGSSIDKYCYINCRELPPFFEHKHRIVYSSQENVNKIDEINHPSVREALRYFNYKPGISIHHDGDIPARSGMGTSSAFSTGLMYALYTLMGKKIQKKDLLKEVLNLEQNLIGENVGSQDQTFSVYGGLNLIDFNTDGSIILTPIELEKNRLENFESNFLLFFTGISRFSDQLAKEQISNIENNLQKIDSMKKYVDESIKILLSKSDLNDFGLLLNETWKIKRSLTKKISTEYIDEIYSIAMNAGATGGKLLGAGGGGFILFYVNKEAQSNVRNALINLLEIPFKFETKGTQIIYNNGILNE